MEFHEPIGEGAFGKVFRVSFKPPFEDLGEGAAKTNIRNLKEKEVHILRTVQHQNIVKFITYISDPVNPILVTELADGSLRTYLDKEKGNVSDKLQTKWIRESAEAICYLHNGIPDEDGKRKPVIHRDLKAANCLLFGDVLKLCDFGLAKETELSTGMGHG